MTTFEIISTIINGTLVSSIIGQAWFYKSKKRKANSEADMTEFDAKVVQIKHFSEQLKEAYIEIDHMQIIIDRVREQVVEGGRLLAETRLELVKTQELQAIAEYKRCDVVCDKRIPPRNNETVTS